MRDIDQAFLLFSLNLSGENHLIANMFISRSEFSRFHHPGLRKTKRKGAIPDEFGYDAL